MLVQSLKILFYNQGMFKVKLMMGLTIPYIKVVMWVLDNSILSIVMSSKQKIVTMFLMSLFIQLMAVEGKIVDRIVIPLLSKNVKV